MSGRSSTAPGGAAPCGGDADPQRGGVLVPRERDSL